MIPASIVGMDRAYNDYAQFAQWTGEGVYFVTRMKDHAVYEILDTHTPPLEPPPEQLQLVFL